MYLLSQKGKIIKKFLSCLKPPKIFVSLQFKSKNYGNEETPDTDF